MITRSMASIAALALLVSMGCTKTAPPTPASNTPPAKVPAPGGVKLASLDLSAQTIEVGCGMCVYKMPGAESCVTAGLVNGAPVLLQGGGAERHAHSFCSAPSQAKVSGKIEGDKVVLSAFEVLKGDTGGS